MKKVALVLFLGILLAGFSFGFSWGQCPEAPNDLGICDTFYVELFDSANNLGNDGFPRNIYFPMYITHDVSIPVDSIAGCIIPIGIHHTNSAAYCSLTYNSIQKLWVVPGFADSSIFRHMPNPDNPSQIDSNWTAKLAGDFSGRDWDFVQLDPRTNDTEDSATWWFSLVPTGSADQRYGNDGIKYVHMETGHAAQNILLQAAALNLGSVPVGAFDSGQIKKIVNMSSKETPLYILPVGIKKR